MELTTQQLKEKYKDEDIKKALGEMLEVMEFDHPPKVEKKAREQLADILEEASSQIYTPDKYPNDYDEFSEKTEQLIKDFGFWPGKIEDKKQESQEAEEQKQEENKEPTKDDIRHEIEDATELKQLKDIAKTYDQFKKIRGELSKYKTTDQLKEVLFEALDGKKKEESKEQEEKAKKQQTKKQEKPAEKKKSAKTAPPTSSERQESVEEAIRVVCKNPATISEITDKADEIYIGKLSNAPKYSRANISKIVRPIVSALTGFGVLKEENEKYQLK